MIPVARPILDDDEFDAAVAVLRSSNLAQGTLVERFERQFAEMIGVKHAVAVLSGTSALHMALLAHRVGPGDEVITTPFTFVGTANSVLHTGARPVFVDICEDTFNIDPEQIAEKITGRTRAILPVHLYGHPADMAAIGEIAARYRLAVVEDAAQALGAAIGNRGVGTFGTACFSFWVGKNVTTGEGGIVTTDDDGIAGRLRLLRSDGQRERYCHEIPGPDFRLTDLKAAIGLVHLERLERLTRQRIANAEYLTARLSHPERLWGDSGERITNAEYLSIRLHNVVTPVVRFGCRHVYHQYTVCVPQNRDEFARTLNAAGIGTSIRYPVPVHRQPPYLDLGYRDHLPVAERASREVLSLPVHPSLGYQELETVARWVSTLVAMRQRQDAA